MWDFKVADPNAPIVNESIAVYEKPEEIIRTSPIQIP